MVVVTVNLYLVKILLAGLIFMVMIVHGTKITMNQVVQMKEKLHLMKESVLFRLVVSTFMFIEYPYFSFE